MKEFIEKLIARLEETVEFGKMTKMERRVGTKQTQGFVLGVRSSVGIVNQLAEEYNNSNDSMEIQIAKNYAKWLTKCGVNVTEKWLTATEQAYALNESYTRGRQDERDKFAKWQDEHKDNAMIDGQYCWQTCGSTEHCKECNRLCNGSIDYYENYDFMTEEHKGGWIACSESLPEVSGEYYTYVYYDGHYMHSVDEIDCNGMVKKWNCVSDYKVVAWKPIAPYQPKGE